MHEREKRRSNLLTSCILAIPALQWLIERNGSQVNMTQVYQVNRIAGRYSPTPLDSQSLKLTTIYTLILLNFKSARDREGTHICTKIGISMNAVLWLALLAKSIFSFVFRCQFTPLLTKRLWDPPLLFTPIPSKSSFRLTGHLDNRLFVYGS